MNQPPYNPYAQPPPPQGYAFAPRLEPLPEDAQNLNVLAICHYVYAGLVGLVGMVVAVYVVIGVLFASGVASRSHPSASGAPPEAAVAGIVAVLGGFFILLLLAKAGLLVYSGMCLRSRRHRMFSFVMACLTCVNIPLGTVLGVFTLVVLSRPSVRALYDGGRAIR
jgi:hypothetical protein